MKDKDVGALNGNRERSSCWLCHQFFFFFLSYSWSSLALLQLLVPFSEILVFRQKGRKKKKEKKEKRKKEKGVRHVTHFAYAPKTRRVEEYKVGFDCLIGFTID